MSMPMAPSGAARTQSRDAAALLSISAEARASIRILVADDEHTLRESCANVLRLEGYQVTVVGRGQEALDLLKRSPFDIVLADLFMAQVDGLTLLRAALAANAGTLVVVMTGNPSIESSIEALRQGAWDYMPKPFSGHRPRSNGPSSWRGGSPRPTRRCSSRARAAAARK
jgi:CheY-like chemotaxis protein